MKHTSGKWEVYNFPSQVNSRLFGRGIAAIGHHEVATAMALSQEEADANAQLIATAPELLETLEYALKAIKAIHSFGVTTAIIDRIESTIKKSKTFPDYGSEF